MHTIDKPLEGEYSPYTITYINHLPDDGEVLKHLTAGLGAMQELVAPLSEAQLLHRYAPGKWSIKEVLVHIIDAERIFAYRALRIGRNDTTPLPGFEENDYAAESYADDRSIDSIMKEYELVRRSTILLFDSLPAETATRSTIINNHTTSLRALPYIIAGHELHHIAILRERYLSN
jgi:uncharacterized damage-inducible protein DinB